jgi:hypothetical protein
MLFEYIKHQGRMLFQSAEIPNTIPPPKNILEETLKSLQIDSIFKYTKLKERNVSVFIKAFLNPK